MNRQFIFQGTIIFNAQSAREAFQRLGRYFLSEPNQKEKCSRTYDEFCKNGTFYRLGSTARDAFTLIAPLGEGISMKLPTSADEREAVKMETDKEKIKRPPFKGNSKRKRIPQKAKK